MISFENILSQQFGSIIISIILGLGFASIFKKVCKNDCIIYKIENYNKIKNRIYRWNDTCYKFEKKKIDCGNKNKELIKEEN